MNLLQDNVGVITMTNTHIELKDQQHDYQYQRHKLSGMNFYEFIMDTYEEVVQDNDIRTEDIHTPQSTFSQPRKTRTPYLAEANKAHKCRVQRTPGHKMMPRFIGHWYPRNNNPTGHNKLHGASILLLLKFWQNLTDLKRQGESFKQSLVEFLNSASEPQKDMVKNIQYYHTCWNVAQKRRDVICQEEMFNLFDYERLRVRWRMTSQMTSQMHQKMHSHSRKKLMNRQLKRLGSSNTMHKTDSSPMKPWRSLTWQMSLEMFTSPQYSVWPTCHVEPHLMIRGSSTTGKLY